MDISLENLHQHCLYSASGLAPQFSLLFGHSSGLMSPDAPPSFLSPALFHLPPSWQGAAISGVPFPPHSKLFISLFLCAGHIAIILLPFLYTEIFPTLLFSPFQLAATFIPSFLASLFDFRAIEFLQSSSVSNEWKILGSTITNAGTVTVITLTSHYLNTALSWAKSTGMKIQSRVCSVLRTCPVVSQVTFRFLVAKATLGIAGQAPGVSQ